MAKIKIGLSDQDKINMANDVYDRVKTEVDGYVQEKDTEIDGFMDTVTNNFNELSGQVEGTLGEQNQEITDFKNEVDNRLDNQDEAISNLNQGGPKGVYENLSALQTAYPSGASGVYVTSDNGHWYYWNGTEWADGGVYQATGIADGSITNDKLSNTITSNVIVSDSINSFIKDNLYGYDYNFKNGITYEIVITFGSALIDSIQGINASTSDNNNNIIQSIIGAKNANVYVSKNAKLSLFFKCTENASRILYYLGNDNLISHSIMIKEYNDDIEMNNYKQIPYSRYGIYLTANFKENVRYLIKCKTNAYTYGISMTGVDTYDATNTYAHDYGSYIVAPNVSISKVIKFKTNETILFFNDLSNNEVENNNFEIYYNIHDIKQNYNNEIPEYNNLLGFRALTSNKYYDVGNLYCIRNINFEQGKQYCICLESVNDIIVNELSMSTFNGNNNDYYNNLVEEGFVHVNLHTNLGKKYIYRFICKQNAESLIFFLNSANTGQNIKVSVYEYKRNERGLYNYYVNPIYKKDCSDPTVWDGKDGYFYCFGSSWNSKNRNILRSTDLITWEDTGIYPFDNTIDSLLTTYVQGVWASKVIKINEWWLFYVPFMGTSSENSMIAVFKSRNPYGKFTFVKILTNSANTGIKDTIDPEVVIGEDNKVYMFFGSTGGGYRLELTDDGMDVANGAVPILVFGTTDQSNNREKIFEGCSLYYRNDYWYMFISSGEYNTSTYKVKMGRSKTLSGNFVDKEGNNLTDGLATTILSTINGHNFYGCGHNGEIFTRPDGKTYMFYHCHSTSDRYTLNDIYLSNIESRPLFIQEVLWDDDGWAYFENDGHPTYLGKSPLF